MRATVEQLQQRLTELRNTFDESFARPVRPYGGQIEDLLAIRVADEPYAVRLDDVAGLALATDTVVTPLPGAPPHLLGVASVRRTVVAVHDLAALLGQARPASPRWLILARGEPPVAVAFDRVDGHLRLPRAATATGEAPAEAGRAASVDVVATPTGPLAVIDIRAVHAALVAAAESADRDRTP
jgi:purine-binding chemotaxis protein CheW